MFPLATTGLAVLIIWLTLWGQAPQARTAPVRARRRERPPS
jgi:hypothetical protein